MEVFVVARLGFSKARLLSTSEGQGTSVVCSAKCFWDAIHGPFRTFVFSSFASGLDFLPPLVMVFCNAAEVDLV
jgi:hypothetical protein